MEWLLFAIVIVFGAVGLGKVGRQRLLDAADPASATEPAQPSKPSLFAPEIDWTQHNPLRRAGTDPPADPETSSNS